MLSPPQRGGGLRSRIFSLEEVLHEAIEVYEQLDPNGAEECLGLDGVTGSVLRASDQYGYILKRRSKFGGMDISLKIRIKSLM